MTRYLSLAIALLLSTGPGWAADGDLDKTFNKTGKVVFGFAPGNDDEAAAIRVAANGSIVVGGWTHGAASPLGSDFALARLKPDGKFDATFGKAGKVVSDFGAAELLRAIALQADGKILALGTVFDAGAIPFVSDCLLARYQSNGVLDPTFGIAGSVRLDFGLLDECQDLFVRSDGKIVLGGHSTGFDGFTRIHVARLDAKGKFDPTFDTDGRNAVLVPGTTASFGFSVASQKDGKVLLGGAAGAGNDVRASWTKREAGGLVGQAGQQPLVARFLQDGRVDTAFGAAGFALLDVPGLVADVAVQADGKIVASGEEGGVLSRLGDGGVDGADFLVWRLLANGKPDNGFGNLGLALVDFFGGADFAGTILSQTGGKTLIAGRTTQANHSEALALARLDGAGKLDSTFGAGGKKTFVLGLRAGAADMVAQKDGKLVIASVVVAKGLSDFGVTRHLGKFGKRVAGGRAD